MVGRAGALHRELAPFEELRLAAGHVRKFRIACRVDEDLRAHDAADVRGVDPARRGDACIELQLGKAAVAALVVFANAAIRRHAAHRVEILEADDRTPLLQRGDRRRRAGRAHADHGDVCHRQHGQLAARGGADGKVCHRRGDPKRTRQAFADLNGRRRRRRHAATDPIDLRCPCGTGRFCANAAPKRGLDAGG